MLDGTDRHTGSSFDSFLEEEGIRDEVEATAVKRLAALRDPRVIAAYRVLKDNGIIAQCVPYSWVMIKIAAALDAAERRACSTSRPR